jgi:hypothetical protein
MVVRDDVAVPDGETGAGRYPVALARRALRPGHPGLSTLHHDDASPRGLVELAERRLGGRGGGGGRRPGRASIGIVVADRAGREEDRDDDRAGRQPTGERGEKRRPWTHPSHRRRGRVNCG